MGVWDPGLPRWMDPLQYFSRKKMLKRGSPVVRQTGRTRSGRQYNAFMQAHPPGNLLKELKRNFQGSASSLRAAQRLRQSSTRTEQEYERKRKKSMPRSRVITGVRSRYKPKYKTKKISPITARLKYVKHVTHDRTNAAYCSFNDIGPRDYHMRCLVEAFLMYYMRKVGENRVTMHTETPHTRTWGQINMTWRVPTSGAEGEVVKGIAGHVDSGGTPRSFDAMVTEIVNDMKLRVFEGYELFSVTIFGTEGTIGGDEANVILYDPDAGRHNYRFKAVARMKVQNTTDADHVEGTLADNIKHIALGDRNNIHANPVDGLVYKFRNAVPKFSVGFLSAQTDTVANQLNDMTEMNNISVTDTSGVADIDLAAFLPNEFKIPPPAPYTIFSNCAGRSGIYIKPGEFKVLKLAETFRGSINSYFKRYCAKPAGSGERFSRGGHEIPPGGTCVMVGLKPTLRTHHAENVELQVETTRYYQGTVSTRPLTAMPITNIVS